MTLDRRQFLSSMAALPLLPSWGALASASGTRATQRSLILVWLDGGMSHIDTFDGKPSAPPDIRGDLMSVKCSVDGVFLSEHLPKLGKALDRCVLLRSMSHGEGNHDRGSHFVLTGHRPSPVLTYASLGSVADQLAKSKAGAALPSYVCIPDAPNYGGPGFLGPTRGPFELGGNPARPDFRVRHLDPRSGVERSLELVAALDRLDGAPRSASERARDELLTQARTLSLDPEARAFFDLRTEAPELRQRYGRHTIGQSCLLARRLVEGGARTVIVRDKGWDHHENVQRAMTYGFPPKLRGLDDGVAALIDDLEQRGLTDRVVVCVASEFGRTPRLNPRGGRDHWPRAQSVLLFGGGLRRGVVVGRTDERGEEPAERPLSPPDLVATLYRALGFDLDRELQTPDGRPIPLVERGGKPIAEALAS